MSFLKEIVLITIGITISIIIFGILYDIYYIIKCNYTIKEIEKNHKSKIVFIKDIDNKIIDRLFILFFPNTVISINDNNRLRTILHNNPNNRIIFLIKTIGGYISSSDSMLNLINNHKPLTSCYIPEYAMSAGTLFALACKKIYMNKYAVIGPTDPQISVCKEYISFNTLSKLIENKPISFIKDKILLNYYETKILYDENIMLVKKYIHQHIKDNQNRKIIAENEIERLIATLSYGNIPHHTEININDIQHIINVNNNIPTDIMKVYNLLNL
jgi:hypothetical protein